MALFFLLPSEVVGDTDGMLVGGLFRQLHIAFILNSLLDSKLSDSPFKINPVIKDVISINVKKYPKIPKMWNHSKAINRKNS